MVLLVDFFEVPARMTDSHSSFLMDVVLRHVFVGTIGTIVPTLTAQGTLVPTYFYVYRVFRYIVLARVSSLPLLTGFPSSHPLLLLPQL